jgi:hypothetical protein
MNPFDDIRMRVRNVRDNIGTILRESIRESAPVIEDKITEQLGRGERGDGAMLPDYSPVSVNNYGKRPGPMTLNDKGDFWRAVEVVWEDDGFTIRNNDWKATKLALTYGREIIEIQPESFLDIRNDILTDVIMFNINRVFVYGSI